MRTVGVKGLRVGGAVIGEIGGGRIASKSVRVYACLYAHF